MTPVKVQFTRLCVYYVQLKLYLHYKNDLSVLVACTYKILHCFKLFLIQNRSLKPEHVQPYTILQYALNSEVTDKIGQYIKRRALVNNKSVVLWCF